MTDRDVEDLLEVQSRSYRDAGEALRRSWPEEDALDREGLAALLGDLRYAVLATARPDGRPHASPVAYSVADAAFWVATVAGVRLRNVRATPWASLVVSEGQDAGAHRALTAEGAARLHEGRAFDSTRERLDERWRVRHGRVPDWAVAFIELEPRRVFSHGRRRA